jgi:hypothetical protein
MAAKHQGSKRSHPQHDKKAMPGTAAAKSTHPPRKPPKKPPMYSGRGSSAGH